jgi:hypothetical protein
VDPRLLVVQRTRSAPVEVARRTLAPPSDLRRELRDRRRRLVVATASGFTGALVLGLSVATALA